MVVKYPIVKKPVSTNNFQQAMKLATALEKRLKRDGMLDDYNRCMKEFLTKPCMREISREECAAWGGPINYISQNPVLKPGSLSTPLRIVSNSSLNNNHSYNSILAKGPNSIKPLFSILVQFRSYEKVCIWDLFKKPSVALG